MQTAVLIAWRDIGCPDRTRALEYVQARYAQEHPAWPVVIGEHTDGAWCKAAAIDHALAQTDAETLVLADADCWTSGLTEAVKRVTEGAPWCVPHRGVHRLSGRATNTLLTTGELDRADLAERAYLGMEGGGLTVLPRDAYEACPLDRRFTGWGSEDESWGWALRTLFGAPSRVKKPLIHLWHPPQERASRARGSLESWDLRKRYARALGNPAAMTALIQEATHDARAASEPAGHIDRAVA